MHHQFPYLPVFLKVVQCNVKSNQSFPDAVIRAPLTYYSLATGGSNDIIGRLLAAGQRIAESDISAVGYPTVMMMVVMMKINDDNDDGDDDKILINE